MRLKSFRKFALILSWERHRYDAKQICKIISPSNIVLRGPFSGMKYPSLNSDGSVLLTKILGSYEDELHEIIFSLIKNNYTEIIDVGCAEGYYAVGFARSMRSSKIYAYDIDGKVLQMCRDMAVLNNAEDGIVFGNFCSPETLGDFKFSGKGLIICDCEGYETTLFNNENFRNLNACDLLIEVHNLIDRDIRNYLENLFGSTHYVQIINSKLKHVDDYEELKSIGIKYYSDKILFERASRMEWMFLKSKTG